MFVMTAQDAAIQMDLLDATSSVPVNEDTGRVKGSLSPKRRHGRLD